MANSAIASFQSGRGNTMEIIFPTVFRTTGFGINFKPKNNSDRKNGVFGFDTIPNKNIVESDYETLKNEYLPLKEQVVGKEYIPSWVSIKKDQIIELDLVWDRKGRADTYTNIAFEPHDDFTFEPENLKDATTVKITCKRPSETDAQILIKADNTLVVGALNIFYPEVKTIDLEWCFVEIQGDEMDIDDLKLKVNKANIERGLNKGFNPGLIDISLINNQVTTVDISEHLENFKKYGYLKTHSDPKIGSYIERSKKSTVLQYTQKTHTKDTNNLNCYFINQKCINEADIEADGMFEAAGGISPTGTGVSYLMLDPDGNIKSENIIHEVMHSLGLEHTFESTHKFKDGKTDNYMDYGNTKKHTYKWQWEKIHKYSKLK